VPVQTGLNDSTSTEVVAGNLQPGDTVVLNAIVASGATATPAAGAGPLPGTRR
jgi:hypothetical protein